MNIKAAILPAAFAACLAALSVPGAHAKPTPGTEPNHELVDKFLVSSDRYAATLPAQADNLEIYLLNLDGSGEQRLTYNSVFDGFASLSPDGKKIVFDSNRNRGEGEPDNTSDLFVMNADGGDPTFLIHGGSPTWSPDGKQIAFQASAGGLGEPINVNPGAATEDSDIFVVNVDDRLEHGTPPRNLTNDTDRVDEDPDWSPDGTSIVYTSHDVNQRPPSRPFDYTTAELYVRAADGTGAPTRLTSNAEEERAPSWSHQGDRIAYMCHDHTGSPPSTLFEICVMNADGTNQRQLTDNNLSDLSNTWSPDDEQIFFQRAMPVQVGSRTFNRNLLWSATTAEGTVFEKSLVPDGEPTGSTFFPDVGVLRVKIDK